MPTCDKIVDIDSLSGVVQPYEQSITEPIKDIFFDQKVYEQYLTSGLLELRARLIAVEDSGEIEKGDKITSYKYKIYLNCDEKMGFKIHFLFVVLMHLKTIGVLGARRKMEGQLRSM